METSYCNLTGSNCAYFPIEVTINSIFLGEPYNEERENREKTIKQIFSNYQYYIADNEVKNIALTCKICQMIQKCSIGIVDLTSYNRNVLIELGMLYGYNKPTFIIINKKEKSKIKLPSNIIGVEQIRYSSYDDLLSKLRLSYSTILKNRIGFVGENIDFLPYIKKVINEIKINIHLKSRTKIISKIIDIKLFDNIPIIIIDKGITNGVLNNMLFEVVELIPTAQGKTIEKTIGELSIFLPQEEISQTMLVQATNIEDPFWKNLFEKKIIGNDHSLRSKFSTAYADETVENLQKYLSAFLPIMKTRRNR